jgi:cytochrome c6
MAIQSCFGSKLVLIFVGIVLLSSCGESEKTTAGLPEEELTGQEIYLENCASCHGSDGKLGLSGAYDLSKSGLTIEEVKKVLNEGRNGMPPMKEILSSQEKVDKVAEYTIELRK